MEAIISNTIYSIECKKDVRIKFIIVATNVFNAMIEKELIIAYGSERKNEFIQRSAKYKYYDVYEDPLAATGSFLVVHENGAPELSGYFTIKH